MKQELITKEIVSFDVDASTKEEVIEFIANKMNDDGRLVDIDGYIKDVLTREESSSTAIGFMTATPHAKSDAVKVASLGFARLSHPIQWNDEEVSVVFQIGVPLVDQGERHLQILSKLFRNLVHDEFRNKLLEVTSEKEIIDILKEF